MLSQALLRFENFKLLCGSLIQASILPFLPPKAGSRVGSEYQAGMSDVASTRSPEFMQEHSDREQKNWVPEQNPLSRDVDTHLKNLRIFLARGSSGASPPPQLRHPTRCRRTAKFCAHTQESECQKNHLLTFVKLMNLKR
ncbi:hypothetical protein TSMEX_006684 [Taenia solium]|eukprot:TsM_001007600 transcript=TsM_001007600 gene=TsM_001007600